MLDKLFHFSGWSFKIGPFNFTFSISGIIEIIIFAVLIYYIIKWVKKTKAWNLLKGVLVLIAAYIVAWGLGLNNLTYLFNILFSSILIAIIVIFQPEIRKALEQLGEKNPIGKILKGNGKNEAQTELSADSVDKIVLAMSALGKDKVGALVVLERDINLDEYVKTGISLDADISSALLEQIFVHNTPLHDGAVIIRGNKIVAATCYLPLSENDSLAKDLGTRHRAGVGISEVSDAITIIASEETGNLSIAVHGELRRKVTGEEIRDVLNGSRLALEDGNKKTAKTRKGRQKK